MNPHKTSLAYAAMALYAQANGLKWFALIFWTSALATAIINNFWESP